MRLGPRASLSGRTHACFLVRKPRTQEATHQSTAVARCCRAAPDRECPMAVEEDPYRALGDEAHRRGKRDSYLAGKFEANRW